MKTLDTEGILQRAGEKHPAAGSKLISDNGQQFIAKDLKMFKRISGMGRQRTFPDYPGATVEGEAVPDGQDRMHPCEDASVS